MTRDRQARDLAAAAVAASLHLRQLSDAIVAWAHDPKESGAAIRAAAADIRLRLDEVERALEEGDEA